MNFSGAIIWWFSVVLTNVLADQDFLESTTQRLQPTTQSPNFTFEYGPFKGFFSGFLNIGNVGVSPGNQFFTLPTLPFLGDADSMISAAQEGNIRRIQELVQSGMNVNIKDKKGLFALFVAAGYGYDELIRSLILLGADVNLTTKEGWTPLFSAASEGHTEVAKILIENGANVNHQTQDRWTILQASVFYGHANVVILLLRNGANVNKKGFNQQTPLFTAVSKGHKQIVENLLRSGALTNITDIDGKTPMDLAIAEGNESFINLLRNADESQKESETERPAVKACQEYMKIPISRVTGGVQIDGGEFLWMAALGYLNEQYKVTFDCGGTVISEFFILTAAHCVKQSRSPVVVRLGKSSLIDNDGIIPVNRQIQEIIRHPNYSILTAKNDIGLIRLARKIAFNVDIVPACLQTSFRDENSSIEMIVTGWGRTTDDNTERPKQLMKTQLQTVSLDQCNETLTNYNTLVNLAALRNGISSSQYCAYDPQGKNDSCQGDSGGPLQYFPNENSNISIVTGIVSFGIGCGTSLPGIYTRVAYYLDWIESIVWSNL